MKKIWIIGLFIFSMFNLAACNTIGGFGEDVEAGGDAISDKAEDVKN